LKPRGGEARFCPPASDQNAQRPNLLCNCGNYDLRRQLYRGRPRDDACCRALINLTKIVIPLARRGGRKRETNMREALNAVMCVLSTGCQRRYLPGICRRAAPSIVIFATGALMACWIASMTRSTKSVASRPNARPARPPPSSTAKALQFRMNFRVRLFRVARETRSAPAGPWCSAPETAGRPRARRSDWFSTWRCRRADR
jgi:hypothetical protein